MPARATRPSRRTLLRLIAVVSATAVVVGAGIASADPPATFTVSANPTAGQPVTFTATGAGACAGTASCSWTFGDLGVGSGSPATHTYLLPGTYTVTLTVSDPSDPAADSTSNQQVTVAVLPPPPNHDPTLGSPQITVSNAAPFRGQDVSFTANASDQDNDTLHYAWTVGGQGAGGDTRTLTTAFSTLGSRAVAVHVTDGHGGAVDGSTSVNVANRVPAVTVTTSPAPKKRVPVTFTANPVDADVPAFDTLGYSWSGGAETSASVQRTYTQAGTYNVTVTVSDGHTTTAATGQVVISNTAPVAALAGPATAPNIGVAATFSAQASGDADADPLSYSWRVDGASVSGSAPTLARAFSTAGAHTVTVTVSDGDGGTSSASATVQVPNRPPTVDFSWSPKAVEKGDVVTFSSSSVDPDGKPLAKQEWDLDGDGRYDDGFGDTATRTYTTTGSREIGLRVTDADGAVATGHLTLVPGNKPPTAAITASPAKAAVGQAVTFTSASRDSDGRIASVAWDLDGDNVFNEGTAATASRAFTSVGVHRVGLKVTDDDGSTDTTFVSVVVGPSSGIAGASTLKGLKILSPFPKIRLAGSANSRGAFIRLLTVRAPKGAKISITCKRGCPRSKLARLARTVSLASMRGSYRAGATLVITVTKKGAIGKYTRITFVKRKAPRRVDLCLWPKSRKPRSCPPGVGIK